MSPKATDVAASMTKTHRNDRSARKPATAAPMAIPRLPLNRTSAKAVTRWPSGTRSAISARLAGRQISVASPARKATTRMAE